MKSPQAFFLSYSKIQSLRAQHPLCHQGQRSQASRAVGEAQGKDCPPLPSPPPHPGRCHSLLYCEEAIWSSPSGRWGEWEGLPVGDPHRGEILRRTKKSSYYKTRQEKFQHKISSAHLSLLPPSEHYASAVCVNQPLWGQKYPLNHKDELSFFWPQAYNSSED